MPPPASPPLPREHGAWTMLAIPLVLGLRAGGSGSRSAWWIVPSALLAFLAHYAIVPWLARARQRKASPSGYARRRATWGTAYLLGSIVFFACAVYTTDDASRDPLLWIASCAGALATVYAVAGIFGTGRSVIAEALGMAGLSLLAPVMSTAAGAPLSRASFGPALLALSYFLSSLTYVRAYDGLRAGDARVRARCVAAHLVVLGALGLASTQGWLPNRWWMAWIPIAVRTLWGMMRPPSNLRALGLSELWVALAFTAIACVVPPTPPASTGLPPAAPAPVPSGRGA